jgi:hypothetical protein
VAAIVRRGPTFSGGITQASWATWGDGRDGASRPFGYHAVMIAHACAHGWIRWLAT